jgi:hypothetical protein
MTTHDVYGAYPVGRPITTRANSAIVDAITKDISVALAIEFDGHDSYFMNGDYNVHKSTRTGRLQVINNVADDDPEDAPYMEYGYQVIVTVDEASAPDELRDRLIALGLTHLRRRVL